MAAVALFSMIIRIEDGEIVSSGAITDSAIAAVLSDATIAGVLSETTIDGAKPNIGTVVSGNYGGNGAANYGIPHTGDTTPKLILIYDTTEGRLFYIFGGKNVIVGTYQSTMSSYNPTAPDSTNFYVGETDMTKSANVNGRSYSFTAFFG